MTLKNLHFTLTALVHETRKIAEAFNGFHINLQEIVGNVNVQ
jgi:hypothetical protein